jgi:hypothetical protein
MTARSSVRLIFSPPNIPRIFPTKFFSSANSFKKKEKSFQIKTIKILDFTDQQIDRFGNNALPAEIQKNSIVFGEQETVSRFIAQ